MPYIKQRDREKLLTIDRAGRSCLAYTELSNAGEIQYAIAKMLDFYVHEKGLSYQTCNDIMGALGGANREFYRRVVAPYEDLKIEQNGDV